MFLLLMECHDIYCEGLHPAGVYSTRALAETALPQALQLDRFFAGTVVAMAMDAPPVQDDPAVLMAVHR